MVSLFTGTQGSEESWGGSLSTGEQGPAYLQPQLSEESRNVHCPGKKPVLCSRYCRSRLISLGGGLPPVGESLAGRSRGPSSWQPWDIQQVLAHALAGRWGGSCLGGGLRAGRRDAGDQAQENMGSRGGVLLWLGGLVPLLCLFIQSLM